LSKLGVIKYRRDGEIYDFKPTHDVKIHYNQELDIWQTLITEDVVEEKEKERD